MLALFAQKGGGAGEAEAAGGIVGGLGGMACCGTFLIIPLAIIVLTFAILWKVFVKAGQPGWAAIVPFYNHYILVTEICKKEILWFILGFIPIANIIALWVITQEVAKKFGKSEGFGVGLFFLAPIFYAILAFGDAEYRGGRGSQKAGDDDDDRPLKRSRDDDDQDDDEDDRPRRKKRRSNDDD